MADTKIEWTHVPDGKGGHKKGETWNPVVGCSPVSEGCRRCYAARDALRLAGNPNSKIHHLYDGLAKKTADGRPVFAGIVRTVPDRLDQPLRWREPRGVFVNSMSDLFHRDVPDEFIDMVFAVMALCPKHTFQVLTKRPERMREYMGRAAMPGRIWDAHILAGGYAPTPSAIPSWPLPNVWLGVSAEDQRTADERIPLLLQTPAAVRFVSAEPLLGPVDLRPWLGNTVGYECYPGVSTTPSCLTVSPGVRWVIVGGESGPGARPCNVAWIRSLVDQCRAAKVACFVKQLGTDPRKCRPAPFPGWPNSEIEYSVHLRSRKGNDPNEWPEDLRVREYPATEGGE